MKLNYAFDLAAQIESDKDFDDIPLAEKIFAMRKRLDSIKEENNNEAFNLYDAYEVEEDSNPVNTAVITAATATTTTAKYRRLVVEFGIVGKNNGKKYPTIILDGSHWGEDFDHLIGGRLLMEYFHDEGQSHVDGETVEYHQTFMLTTMSDEEILAIYI